MSVTNPTILLVEDNRILQKVQSWMITEAGYCCEVVGNAQQALELFIAKPIDLVVTDIGLPDKSGVELIGGLRAIELQRGATPVPILVITAYIAEEVAAACLAAGANRVLDKPLTRQVVKTHLQQLLAQFPSGN